MKIIFLDIDGVLNTQASRRRHWELYKNLNNLDRSRVEVLNQLCIKIGGPLQIIISSTWRMHFELSELKEMLYQAGFLFCSLITGRTRDDVGGDVRGSQIRDWLATSENVNGFVILDDNTDMYPYRKHLLQTSDLRGLEEKHIKQICRILEIPWPAKIIHSTP